MNRITLHQPRRLEFGAGCLAGFGDYLRERAPARVFLVTTPAVRAPVEDAIREACGGAGRLTVDDSTLAEPTVRHLEAVLAAATDARPDVVVSAGGGSVLDVGKLVAALLDTGQAVQDVFGSNLVEGRSTPSICVPTTAGTGSEVSPNSILHDADDGLKKAVISPHLMPDATFFDPALTLTVPPAVTAATGLDALTHCIEVYANRFAHPLTDTYALDGIRLIAAHLARAVSHGDDLDARSAVALGSLYGGLGLGPVNTAAVHALAYPLGSRYGIPHGVSNAVLLPHVVAFNIPAAPRRYAMVARALGAAPGDSDLETAYRGLELLRRLCAACGILRSLAELGVPRADIPLLVRSGLGVERLMRNNVRDMTERDATAIYEVAFQTKTMVPELETAR
jgi:alcohol dehydrogenase